METGITSTRRRPKLVWVVFLWFLFSPGFTLLLFLLIHSGVIAVRPEEPAYLRSLSTVDYALTIIIVGLGVAGALSLFRLRKVAFYLFVAHLILTLGAQAVHVLTTGLLATLDGWGTFRMFVGWAGLVAVCVYAWKLKARGVLV